MPDWMWYFLAGIASVLALGMLTGLVVSAVVAWSLFTDFFKDHFSRR